MTDIAAILNEAANLRDKRRKTLSSRAPDHWSPSSASIQVKDIWSEPKTVGACLRRLWYEMTGHPGQQERFSRAAAYGDVVSDLEVELAREAGIYLGHEVPMFKDIHGLRISGRADLLVEVPLPSGNKERIGAEYKSVHGYYGTQGVINTTRTIPYAPKPYHVLQAALYLDHWKDLGFTHWQILYIDRGSGTVSVPAHKVYLTPEGDISVNSEQFGTAMDGTPVNVRHIYERFLQLDLAVKAKAIPDRDYEHTYSPEKIEKMAAAGMLSKTDMAKLARKRPKTPFDKGDWQCRIACPFLKLCYPDITTASDDDEPAEIEE